MSNIIYSKRGRVVTIVLNRPEVLNTLNVESFREFSKALISFRDDSQAWVCIVTGAGDKAFSAGADLGELSSPLPILPQSIMRGLELYKPIIAAVNGIAYGGGFEIVLACDFVIASDNAYFSMPEVKHGLIPGWGGTQRLPRALPKVKATEMILMGVAITAQEAYELGLVNKVTPRSEVMRTAKEWAAKLCENAPLAVSAAKESILKGLNKSLEDGLRLELALETELIETEDAEEGISAFREKRKPVYKRK